MQLKYSNQTFVQLHHQQLTIIKNSFIKRNLLLTSLYGIKNRRRQSAQNILAMVSNNYQAIFLPFNSQQVFPESVLSLFSRRYNPFFNILNGKYHMKNLIPRFPCKLSFSSNCIMIEILLIDPITPS